MLAVVVSSAAALAVPAQLARTTKVNGQAIQNVQAREDLRSLADEQGALRRVATLVAQGAEPGTVFAAVAGEAAGVLGVNAVSLLRYDPAAAMFTKVYGPSVAAPIVVDGAIWGFLGAYAETGEILPRGCELRLANFTHLVASSISNAHARDSLIASRARIVTASDETRRRIERNLHDGIQQRVVALALGLRAVRAGSALPPEVEAGLDEVTRDLEGVVEEIRVFSRGLHPALLSRSGLGPSLRALARRSPVPVSIDAARVGRLPEPTETAVYYVVSEALANAAKHSRASEVTVTVISDATGVRATIADDGVGGAAPARGSGLIGLVDRVEALGGKLTLESPPGRGTTISIELPGAGR